MFQILIVAMVLGGLALEVYSYWAYYHYRDRSIRLALGIFLPTQLIAFAGIVGGILLYNQSQALTPEEIAAYTAQRHRDTGPITPPTPPTEGDMHRHAREAVLEHVFTPSPPRFAESFTTAPHDPRHNIYDVNGSFVIKGFTGEQTQRFAVRIDFTHEGDFRKTISVSVNDEVVFQNE